MVKQVLKDKGVKYTLVEFPGYIHEWPVWRVSLKDLLPRLFQLASGRSLDALTTTTEGPRLHEAARLRPQGNPLIRGGWT